MAKTGKLFVSLLIILALGVASVFGYAGWRSSLREIELSYKDELSKSRLFNQSSQQTISDLLAENEKFKRENNKLTKENERLAAELKEMIAIEGGALNNLTY